MGMITRAEAAPGQSRSTNREVQCRQGGDMTDQEPVQDALSEAATSLMRTLGVILLTTVVPILLLGAIGMLFFASGGAIDH